MAWAGSSIFRQYVADIVENTTAMDWTTDASVKAALYNNTTAPDNDVTAANTAYAVGQWVVGNEVTDGTNWDTAGEPVTSRVTTLTADTITLDGADTPQSGASCTLASVFGCRSEEHTSELQSLMRISYAVFCLTKKKIPKVQAHSKTLITNQQPLL